MRKKIYDGISERSFNMLSQTGDSYFIRYYFEEDGEAEIVIKNEVADVCPPTIKTVEWLLFLRNNRKAITVDESLILRRAKNVWNVSIYIKANNEFPFERHYFLNVQVVNKTKKKLRS